MSVRMSIHTLMYALRNWGSSVSGLFLDRSHAITSTGVASSMHVAPGLGIIAGGSEAGHYKTLSSCRLNRLFLFWGLGLNLIEYQAETCTGRERVCEADV